jgi:transcriptional regulator with XRE-family HTH domain
MDNKQEITKEYINETHKIIGKNVKRVRESKNMSQLELSYLMGHKSVSVVSCAEINHKNSHFNIEHLIKISKALDVDICEFFKGV